MNIYGDVVTDEMTQASSKVAGQDSEPSGNLPIRLRSLGAGDSKAGLGVRTMSTSALPCEILRNGLTPCYYLMLLCREHGEIRTAIAEIPAGRFDPCPICARNCGYTLLGEGGTQRSLPFWDEIRESISMRQLIDNQWVLHKARASAVLS